MNGFDDSIIVKSIIASVLGNRTDIIISLKYSDDLYSDAVALCENETYLGFLKSLSHGMRARFNSFNGAYILPRDIFSKQLILVSNKQRSDGYSHFSTIAHETQHAKNHTIFCELYCNKDINQISEHANNASFQVWDEFAARRTGHRLYSSYTLQKILGFSELDLQKMLEEDQFPIRLKQIHNILSSGASMDQYKEIAAILGMFHVWETDYSINIESRLGAWALELYLALSRYDSIETVDFATLSSEINKLRSSWERGEF